MNEFFRMRRRGGFTLIELMVVVAIIMLLVGVAAAELLRRTEASARCPKVKEEALATIARCRQALSDGTPIDGLESCLNDGRRIISEWCEKCGPLSDEAVGLINDVNTELATYRETLSEADRGRVAALPNACP